MTGSHPLGRVVSRSGFFTLAFGAIVGSGWVLVLGDWLREAGPAGTVVGFAAGAVVMIIVALCYGELAGRSPRAGAEFLYVLQSFGRDAGFLVAWFLTLYAISVCAFEGIALGWILKTLWPALDGGVAYTLLGSSVTWGAIAIGAVGTCVVGAIHYSGSALAIRVQNVVTYGFILISAALIAIALLLGDFSNLAPLSPNPPHSSTSGALWVFSTCAFFLNGWQTALHAIEERRPTTATRDAILSMVAAIAAAAAFYALLVIAASSALPWQRIVGADLPAIAAFRALPGGRVLSVLLLVAAAVSLTKAWTAMVWVASRLIYAQAREGLLPRSFLDVEPVCGTPRRAIVVVMAIGLAGILAGRGAIVPIVDMVSICIALSIILCLIVLLRARRSPQRMTGFAVPGGTTTVWIGLAGAVAMVGIALVKPLFDHPGVVPPEWVMILVWAVLGIALRWNTRRVSGAAGFTESGTP